MLTRFYTFASKRWSSFLYRCSLFLVVFFTCGFIIITPADLISQALRNEQIYNFIIVAASYFAVAVTAIFLYAIRVYGVRSALADIPKRYVPGEHDLPQSFAKVIEAELMRCRMIEVSLQPSDDVSHPGLPPPNSDFDFSQVPYIEVLQESIKLLETKALSVHPGLKRRPGMPLREYIMFLEEYVSLDGSISRRFIEDYEEVRFSGCQISEDRFKNIMRTFTLLLRSVYLPGKLNDHALERIDTIESWDGI